MEILIIILGLIADRLTKVWALNTLSKVDEIVVIKNIFGFSYLENRGAAFGVFQNKVFLLGIVTSIVIAAMIFYLLKYKPASKLLRTSIALIIAVLLEI